ncbi:MAG: DNA-processing protein DprA [Dehalococcoidia bacterium]|nr:DNA-processing protein DprA [Dehalococcoidia bacterium]
MPDTNEIQFWIGFTKIPGIGKSRLAALCSYFGNLEKAWKAPKSDLIKAGLDDKTADMVVSCRRNLSLNDELNQLDKYGIKVLTYQSPEYPPLLKETSDYPPVLYIRGELGRPDETSVAVVGTRRATAYGKQVTDDLVTNLVANGITIVSGLAKGIDTVAHRTAIEAHGKTIAVFASGLDIVYPPENVKLAREIMQNGALVSEFPLGTKPKAEHFPRRNRILSGLSSGVIVIESGETGGALITANFAAEQNREVFAVPGSIFSVMSKGPNKLIQEGAKLVRNHLDVLEELNLSAVSQQLELRNVNTPDGIESVILKYIADEPIHIDEICRHTGLNTAIVASNLAIMELNGMVRHASNMSYILGKNKSN